ncbi:cell cycle serine/threonine-protein kinase Cdc5p/MSD2 [[Candida] jaroonii]|uniref:Cell cycle serine/threonine-protein kinase Cdc5p/MSD2 n=1 Tax=[Candida] jaroonii TaxID=467808 RepID=A0ACA9Y3J6_9ASCO|nr:cell cycle serine/threonine-protein kinase Cdc5p/MSD2 [[Candida] jaroonii]
MSVRTQPLQPLNNGQINARSNNITPIKLKKSKDFYEVPSIQPPQAVQQQQQNLQKKKKKEKLSALCKTPPSVVRTRNGRDYKRGLFLGEGGFARCFQMKDSSGQIYAAKTVAKASIKNEKTKTKLLSEIKIHKSLNHPNIVNFIDCFEDDINVYILLEICPNQSLVELLKTRKRLTEPEVRFFMVQIIGAVKYLHSRRVIHRDLKLGNIFFDPQMNLKIGDFGLASILPSNDSRKYTICGTPNYIAPEVLGGKNNGGHSFEVDIWAIGIMMYALLVGKPPFQSKDVQIIYERIKKSDYDFPIDKPISEDAKHLIRDLLETNPIKRPSINEILNYNWFKGTFPDKINEVSLTKQPEGLDLLSKGQSAINFNLIKANSGIYTPKAKNPVEILKTDLQSESRTVLPKSLSPNDTKLKYKEVDANVYSTKKKIQFNSNFQNSIVNLNSTTMKTYTNIRKMESIVMNGLHDNTREFEITNYENPTLISKWVDYSNKYGFSYQLNNDDIGVLFNDNNTLLKLTNDDQFLELLLMEDEGWTCIENNISNYPNKYKRQLEIVDFFAKYMNSNLSKVSDLQQRKEIVFLRRYTRTSEFIMFEMTNGNFQFNFKDHHKIVISNNGLLITHISPNRITQTHPLLHILRHGDFPSVHLPDCLDKISIIKEAIQEKAYM